MSQKIDKDACIEMDQTNSSLIRPIRIGILAMQGAFREHCRMMENLGCECKEVRKPEDMKEIDGLIIPGGESTTIGKLIKKSNLYESLQRNIQKIPVYGTCAGAILLAKEIVGSSQINLEAMDISILRNGYGRQVESFEVDLEGPLFADKPFRAVFIRAPIIKKMGAGVEVLAELEGDPVLVRQRNILVSSFHPELTDDSRIHAYFLGMIKTNLEEKIQLRRLAKN